MAAKGSTLDSDLLKLLFNATPIAGIADNAASSPLTNLYVSLHTASPGAGGDQTTNEAAYGDYARQAVARTSGAWGVGSGTVSPADPITFPAASSGAETETHFAIGTAASGAGKLLYFGPISPTIPVAVPVAPQLTTATAVTES
jgi:hypothetical protein